MKNKLVKLKCVDMTVDGLGVCKDGELVVFVKGMILDEEAIVKIIAYKKTLAYGIIDTLLKASPYRVTSLCPIAYKCGGCDLRHIRYDFTLSLKRDILENTFNRMHHLDVKINEIMASDKVDYYRNKVQVPVRDGKFGFYRKNSNDIVEFDECYVQTETSNAIIKYLKEELIKRGIDSFFRHILIKHAEATNEVMVAYIVHTFKIKDIQALTEQLVLKFPMIQSVIMNLNDQDTNVILGKEERLLYGRPYIIDELDGLKFEISLKSFYQINPGQMHKLYDQVYKLGKITKEDRVLDLFSGIGTISLYLARYAKEVVGVEIVEAAVLNAKENAKRNGIENVKFYLGDAKDDLDRHLKDKDVVVVDPPRKGLNKQVIEKLVEHHIPKIVYVSCNPATLARDLKIFKEAGYRFDTIQGVDMFPYTVHVECIVCLSREKVDDYIRISVHTKDLQTKSN